MLFNAWRGVAVFLWLTVVALATLAPVKAAESGVGGRIDLTNAPLVLPPGLTGPEKKAATMLVEEAEKRSQIRWPISDRLPEAGRPAVVLGQRAALVRSFPTLAEKLAGEGDRRAEGYQIISAPGTVIVAGNDARGVLFGAGRLLRLLEFSRGGMALASDVNLATAPRYPLRGHQVGYRPKTNSYDGWDVATWEQYIRDLVIFGTNAIEGVPPLTDDAVDSPHFPLPPLRMMAEQSRLAQEYGIEYWVWYPALDRNRRPTEFDDPAKVAAAVNEWAAVLNTLPQLDALFLPGGDPGRTPPKQLFPMLEQLAARLKERHPNAKIWMSPQDFTSEWMVDFSNILKSGPAWLEGVVYGPGIFESLAEVRAMVPKRYKLRFYPDITHSMLCQFPVPDWDFAFGTTQHRETINPRPVDQAAIFRLLQPSAEHGFLTYSEGCNDDVNKFVWSGLGWDPDVPVIDILRDYSRYFLGAAHAEGFAQGLLALERNWRGPLKANEGVFTTLAQFQAMERAATPALTANYRFQMALYRAYYDAFLRARLFAESAREDQALEHLRRAREIGSDAAMTAARAALEPPSPGPGAAWRARVFELAEALFQSIRMQLSVTRYKAIAVHRGANLDLIDSPLNNAAWLRLRFDEIALRPDEAERLVELDQILNWKNPGPGGFYDNLGEANAMPHVVLRLSYAEDPSFVRSPRFGYILPGVHTGGSGVVPWRLPRSSWRFLEMGSFLPTAGAAAPLEMIYRELDPKARYRLRVIYAPEKLGRVALTANERFALHPLLEKTVQTAPLEFEIPAEATAGGELRLAWTGSGGRVVQVAEVWLVRAP